MRIGVISDTHRKNFYIQKAVDKMINSDMIFHLGDNVEDVNEIKKKFKGEIISVKGNCDLSSNTISEKIVVCEGKKIFITHGHNYAVKDGLLRLRYRALEVGADIVLYGHTHISKIDLEEGIFFINPGSTTFPRNGFNTIASIEIKGKDVAPCIISI